MLTKVVVKNEPELDSIDSNIKESELKILHVVFSLLDTYYDDITYVPMHTTIVLYIVCEFRDIASFY
jgi:hypothetical protein